LHDIILSMMYEQKPLKFASHIRKRLALSKVTSICYNLAMPNVSLCEV
jgi:hypothetical protein